MAVVWTWRMLSVKAICHILCLTSMVTDRTEQKTHQVCYPCCWTFLSFPIHTLELVGGMPAWTKLYETLNHQCYSVAHLYICVYVCVAGPERRARRQVRKSWHRVISLVRLEVRLSESRLIMPSSWPKPHPHWPVTSQIDCGCVSSLM